LRRLAPDLALRQPNAGAAHSAVVGFQATVAPGRSRSADTPPTRQLRACTALLSPPRHHLEERIARRQRPTTEVRPQRQCPRRGGGGRGKPNACVMPFAMAGCRATVAAGGVLLASARSRPGTPAAQRRCGAFHGGWIPGNSVPKAFSFRQRASDPAAVKGLHSAAQPSGAAAQGKDCPPATPYHGGSTVALRGGLQEAGGALGHSRQPEDGYSYRGIGNCSRGRREPYLIVNFSIKSLAT
jgi:hypothetical protein